MQRAYYLIKDGEILKSLKEQHEKIEIQRHKTFDVVKEISQKYGCDEKQWYSRSDHKLMAFVFKTPPDKNIWKKVEKGYYPKKNSKQAKEILNQLSFIKSLKLEDALPKKKPFNRNLCDFRHMYWTSCYYLLDKFVISVPFEEFKSTSPDFSESQEELSQLEEIKPYEFQKLIDQHNEQIKKEINE